MDMLDKTIAIIPARGGSKRLPRKNIVRVSGRPVLDYTIKAAKNARLFDHIIVSTEDNEIAEVARISGAEVWRRGNDLASDTATMDDVVKDVLEQFKLKYGAYPKYFSCLLATSALRTSEDIISAYSLLEPGVCDFVMTYKEYESSPHEALRLDADGGLAPMWPDIMFQKRWDRPKLVRDAGSVYWLNTTSFLEQDTFFGDNLKGHLLPPERAVDLDVPADLEIMEYYMQKKQSEGGDV
jgi:N-acylneuraminate cytidylyltransferase